MNNLMAAMLSRYFINPEERRLRAGWRVGLFSAFLAGLLTLLVMVLRETGLPGRLDEAELSAVLGISVALTATLAVCVCRRILDRKSVVSLGIGTDRNALKDLLFGFMLSGLLVGLLVLALYLMGWLKLETEAPAGNQITSYTALLLFFVGVGATVAWWEELVMRGYILQNLRDGFGLTAAIVISCILYGAVHMANPNSSWVSGLLIAAIGYLRIFGWLRTGQLWLSMGMHAGWNFFQGPLFGFSVSGRASTSLMRQSLTGPAWVTGGAFGPEAGIIVVPVIILGLALMALWTSKRKKEFETP